MKSFAVCALAVLFLVGCSATISRTTYAVKQRMIATTGDAWLDTDDGRKIPVALGDTLLSTSYEALSDIMVGAKTRYFIEYKGEKGYITHLVATAFSDAQSGIITEYDYSIKKQSLIFKVHSSQDKDTWARANYYVNTNSDMKVQTANDFLVDTYNPTSYGKRAFTITRLPQGDSVQYDVQRGGTECAFFMLTGKARKDFYIN